MDIEGKQKKRVRLKQGPVEMKGGRTGDLDAACNTLAKLLGVMVFLKAETKRS